MRLLNCTLVLVLFAVGICLGDDEKKALLVDAGSERGENENRFLKKKKKKKKQIEEGRISQGAGVDAEDSNDDEDNDNDKVGQGPGSNNGKGGSSKSDDKPNDGSNDEGSDEGEGGSGAENSDEDDSGAENSDEDDSNEDDSDKDDSDEDSSNEDNSDEDSSDEDNSDEDKKSMAEYKMCVGFILSFYGKVQNTLPVPVQKGQRHGVDCGAEVSDNIANGPVEKAKKWSIRNQNIGTIFSEKGESRNICSSTYDRFSLEYQRLQKDINDFRLERSSKEFLAAKKNEASSSSIARTNARAFIQSMVSKREANLRRLACFQKIEEMTIWNRKDVGLQI